MTDEDVRDVVKIYLKDNLSIHVVTEKHYGDFGSGEGVRVSVSVALEGETIASSYDYTSL